MSDLVLPAFMMDCRDWMVVSAQDAGLAEPSDDVPTVAVLSTMVIDDDIHEATGALTVGLLDDAEPLDTRQVAPGADALELLDDAVPGTRRYVIPAPVQVDGEQNLALLAEFTLEGSADDGELNRRVDALMTSFRWQGVAA